jgi:membrane protease YdiL (CAAX protease family)
MQPDANKIPPLPNDPVPAVLPVEEPLPSPPSYLTYWIGWGIFLVAYVALFFLGEKTRRFALTGLEVLPFLALAVLAYLGDRNPDLRILAFAYWVLLMVIAGVGVFLFSFIAVMQPAALDRLTATSSPPTGGLPDLLISGSAPKLALIALSMLSAGVLSLCMFLRRPRRTAAGLLPMYSDSFVHTVALATLVAMILVQLIPLTVLGQPPLLEIITHFEEYRRELEHTNPDLVKSSMSAKMIDELGKEDQSLDYVAFLAWLVPSAVLAVGFPFVRTIRESLIRVGLVRPSVGQIVFGLFAAIALVGIMLGLDAGISALWNKMGWPTTNEKAVEKLLNFAFNPLGAVIIGVVAGLGEELFVRGVLQPRMGIVLSNLFFTAMHALQYNWDGLLSVFIIGLALGLIRKRTNTTTSAIVHGTYDFTLLLLTYYSTA